MAAKAGYTRSGKSLKAVRRYYALLNAAKRGEGSPDEDKLSKRIAAELRTQQNANEKRGAFDNSPTDRSALPTVIMSPKETGPVFIAPNTSAKSIKSAKSAKSAGVIGQITDGQPGQRFELSQLQMYYVVITMFLAVNLTIAWFSQLFFRYLLKKLKPNEYLEINNAAEDTYFFTQMLGMASVVTTLALIYWLFLRHRLAHAIINLLAIVASATLIAYAVIIYIENRSTAKSKLYYWEINDHIMFYLSVSYLILHILLISLMIRQVMHNYYERVREKSIDKSIHRMNLSAALAAA